MKVSKEDKYSYAFWRNKAEEYAEVISDHAFAMHYQSVIYDRQSSIIKEAIDLHTNGVENEI